MANVAVLGYGTIGAGVVKVLQTNEAVITKRIGEKVEVKRILDLRDFPGDPNEDKVVHDYAVIENDPDIDVVVECMGGVNPAYKFVKTALLQGRSVATSNKELVASHGAELIAIAAEKEINFLFEASVGGGIPIIRPMISGLSADVIESVRGILNGTTNYMLTRMEEAGISFDEALREAQEKGYAELHPEADVDGYDACRKIAILTSIACEAQVDYEDIYTEGISRITAEDISYARIMKKTSVRSCHNRRMSAMAVKTNINACCVRNIITMIMPKQHIDISFERQGPARPSQKRKEGFLASSWNLVWREGSQFIT